MIDVCCYMLWKMVCDIMLVMAVWLENYSLNRLGSRYMLGCVGGKIPSYLSYVDTSIIGGYLCCGI